VFVATRLFSLQYQCDELVAETTRTLVRTASHCDVTVTSSSASVEPVHRSVTFNGFDNVHKLIAGERSLPDRAC